MDQAITHPGGSPLWGAPDQVRVSVIIPAYNAAATIVRAIDSVRTQIGTGDVEVLIINDGSGDDTAAVVRAAIVPGERIYLIDMARNSGVSAARNAGVRVARGQFLAFLDADDVWLPGKLKTQVAAIERDPAITLVSCNSLMTAPNGDMLKEGHRNRPPVQGPDAWKTLLVYNFIPTPTVLTRTALVQQLGGFDETLAVGEDLDLWIKLAVRGTVVTLPDILIHYYDFANSLMKRHERFTGDIVVPMIEKHLREQAGRLSSAETRMIRGQRAFQIGCDTFFSGSYAACIPMFIQSARNGTRPLKSISYIPRALLMAGSTRLKKAFLRQPT